MKDGDAVVILLAPPRDVHAIAVACEIERLGARPLVLDTAAFPGQWEITLDLTPGAAPAFSIHAGDLVIRDHDVTGVWYRRVFPHHVVCESPVVRRFCRSESRTLFEGWAHELGSRLLNPRPAELRATHKAVQLCAASRAGLAVPTTSMTNRAASARALRGRVGDLVYKTFTPIQAPLLLGTRVLTDDLDARLDRLRYAPVIFQERIPKACDIRATIVDDEIFAVEIHARGSAGPLDWRTDASPEIRPHDLTLDGRQKLLRLMQELGLRFGAADLALTPEGEYIFFELNPSGQFLFAEIHGGVPITAALARALIRGSSEGRPALSPPGRPEEPCSEAAGGDDPLRDRRAEAVTSGGPAGRGRAGEGGTEPSPSGAPEVLGGAQ